MEYRRKKVIRAIPIAAGIPATLIFLDGYDVRMSIAIAAGFLAFWLACFALDVTYTIRNRHLIGYESSVIFSSLHARLGLFAIPAQCLVDFGFALLITIIVVGSLDFGYVGIVAAAFGLLHLDAYRSNRKFVQNFP